MQNNLTYCLFLNKLSKCFCILDIYYSHQSLSKVENKVKNKWLVHFEIKMWCFLGCTWLYLVLLGLIMSYMWSCLVILAHTLPYCLYFVYLVVLDRTLSYSVVLSYTWLHLFVLVSTCSYLFILVWLGLYCL